MIPKCIRSFFGQYISHGHTKDRAVYPKKSQAEPAMLQECAKIQRHDSHSRTDVMREVWAGGRMECLVHTVRRCPLGYLSACRRYQTGCGSLETAAKVVVFGRLTMCVYRGAWNVPHSRLHTRRPPVHRTFQAPLHTHMVRRPKTTTFAAVSQLPHPV